MKYYAELFALVNTPFDANFQLPKLKNTQLTHWPIGVEYINPKLKSQLAQVGLSIGGLVLFYKSKKTIGALHSDIVWDHVTSSWKPWYAAINWDLNNTRSKMYWYQTDQPGQVSTPEYSTDIPGSYRLNGIHYGSINNINFKDNPEYILLDEIDITVPTLVRTNIPHSVENLADQPRWCLSIRFLDNPEFDDCLKQLT